VVLGENSVKGVDDALGIDPGAERPRHTGPEGRGAGVPTWGLLGEHRRNTSG
jgi:hypothetical protein